MKVRYQFLDVFRGLIVLLMIEGHVLRELLTPALQNTPWFRFHELLHGVTGPGFLFGAGITFGISAQARWREFLVPSPALRRRIKKIALLLALAYALHLPFLSLSKTLSHATANDWRSFWSFDVLQCIGFSLFFLQLMVLVVRNPKWFERFLVICAIGVLASAPLLWNVEGLSEFLSFALTMESGSVYPLVPYSAFLFAGAFVSYEFMRFAQSGREAVFIRRLSITGIILQTGGFVLEALPFQIYPQHDYWLASPNFLLIKLGVIFLLLSGAWYATTRINHARSVSAVFRWLIVVGVESLFVYVIHLIALYGWVSNPEFNLSAWSGNFGLASSAGIAAVFTVVMILSAYFWHFLKTAHPVLVRGLNGWAGTIIVLEFLTRAY